MTERRDRDWYSVSVDLLRAWGLVLVVAVLAVGAFFGYRAWEARDLARRAGEVIAESQQLMGRIGGAETLPAIEQDYSRAVATLRTATTAYDREAYRQALTTGQRSRALFLSLLDGAGGLEGDGVAQVLGVHGPVEYRRSDGGAWQRARARLVLYPGDQVRTGGGGSAEILFLDGTLYTARAGTQFIVSRSRTAAGTPGGQSIRMEYGWVNLRTERQGGRVATPEAEAQVAGDSEAAVGYDADSKRSLFAAYRGGMAVTTPDGQRQEVGEMEQVIGEAGQLGAPRPLPPPPEVVRPTDQTEVDLARADRLVLEWRPVPVAGSYALQVARNHLFVDTIIEDSSRSRTRATLGLRREGAFLWRVAAQGADGARGPWSEPQRFRVVAGPGAGVAGDDEPPELELAEVRSYGSIFIVGGRTEVGATVQINGEQVQVAADGSFTKTIQIQKEGWSLIEVRARDVAGNESVATPRVFVEIL